MHATISLKAGARKSAQKGTKAQQEILHERPISTSIGDAPNFFAYIFCAFCAFLQRADLCGSEGNCFNTQN
jgi:hypothetical protein